MTKIALILLLLAAGSGAGYCATAGPVLIHFGIGDHVLPVPYWSLLNPLRDREPEATAKGFLQELRAARAQHAFSQLPGPPDQWARYIDRETEKPLERWTLRYRSETETQVELLYKFYFSESRYRRAAKLRLERPSALEPWVIVDYDTYY